MNEKKNIARSIEQAKKGDQEAFAQIYMHFSQRVFFYALKMLRNESDATDVLQEVMLGLYKNLDSLKNPKALQIYLYRAAYNTALNMLRKKNVQTSGDENEFILEYIPETKSEFIPESYAEIQERREYVVGLVEDLRPGLRAVILLYYYDGLAIKQIAQVLDLNTETVKNRLFRARETLKRKMKSDMEKQKVLYSASVPVLTRILRSNAEQTFTPELQGQAWQNIAHTLGFSSAIAISTAVAAPPAAAVIAGLSKVQWLAALLATSGVVATAVVVIPDSAVPLWGESPVQMDISPGQQAGDDINAPISLPGDPHTQGAAEFPEPHAGPHTPQSSAENSSSAETSGNYTEGEGFVIQITNKRLSYPAGTQLTAELLLDDCGISLSDLGLQVQDISIYGMDLIDTNKPDNYAVILLVPQPGRQEARRVVLVIEIYQQ